ncbi:hypothetical protein DOY81_011550, partial [Sarcophaga bullata]
FESSTLRMSESKNLQNSADYRSTSASVEQQAKYENNKKKHLRISSKTSSPIEQTTKIGFFSLILLL